MAKTIYRIQHTKNNRIKWKWKKLNGKLGNRINVKLLNNEIDYLKRASETSYISHKVLNNNLVAMRKCKITLTLNKPEYLGLCILDLNKV